ncbi:MAG: beta-L-arabinofuranosidase domain-containing protein [Aggregatilineales bacterium]
MQHVIANGRQIKVHSQLDKRLRLALDRIVNDASFDDAFVLEDVARVPGYNRQFEDWSGDISGRYIGALALCSTYTGEGYPQMHRVAHAIPQFQRVTGLVGTDQAIDAIDFKVAWGQGRLLMGLLEYHAVYPDERIVQCAIDIGDYYVRSLPYWSEPEVRRQESFTCYSQGILSVVLLYRATRDPHYLETAIAMAALMPDDIDGADTARDTVTFEAKGRHSHGYLSTLLGFLAVYEETRDVHWLARARDAQAVIASSRILPDGSPPEYFPWSNRDEGCSTADWLMLNLTLGRITGEAGYFEEAERTWRNGLYGNQAANGGFCHHHFNELGFTGTGNEAWWCCAYHGPKAFYEVMRHTCTWNDEGVWLQFVEPLDIVLPTNSGAVSLSIATDYPNSGHVEISVTQAPSDGIPLFVRIPQWATLANCQIDGARVSVEVVNGYWRVSGLARPGTNIALDLAFGLRLQTERDGRHSFWYGPLILTAESPAGALEAVVVPPLDEAGAVHLTRLSDRGSEFGTPAAYFKIVGLGNSHYTLPLESISLNRPQIARLRPLAEQTYHFAPPPAPINLTVIEANTPLLLTELERALRAS